MTRGFVVSTSNWEGSRWLSLADGVAMEDPHRAVELIVRAIGLASSTGHRLRLAQALKARTFLFRPQVKPLAALEASQEARAIYAGHDLPHEATSCSVRACVAMTDAGIDQPALELGRRLLSEGGLDAAERAAVAVSMALSNLHLGRLLVAWELLETTAEPAALLSGLGRAVSRVRHVQSMALLARALSTEAAGLWLVEGETRVPVPVPVPQLGTAALQYLDEAISHADGDSLSGHFTLTRLVATVVLPSNERGIPALDALALQALHKDASLSVQALWMKAALQLRCGHLEAALATCDATENLIASTEEVACLRDCLLVKAQALQLAGRHSEALVALARHAQLLAQSIGQGDSHADLPAVSTPAAGLVPRQSVAPGFVRRAVAYIEAEATCGLRVAAVARHCGVSRRTLESAFQAHRGGTVASYILRVGMDKAARQLRETDWPVSRIAKEAGYRSAAAFSRAFKAHIGTAPAVWRRAMGPGGSRLA